MRKFVKGGAVKYTDNEIKARNLKSIGYKEVEADKAPDFKAQADTEPKDPEAETKEVEVGNHTKEEPTTDKVEAAAAPAEEPKEEPKKTTKKSSTKKK